MWLKTSCELAFDISIPTPFIMMLRPRSGVHQWIAREEYNLTPHVEVIEYTDHFNNLCQRLVAPPGAFSIRTNTEIRVSDTIDCEPGAPFVNIEDLPDATFQYLLPSRYCESDRFGDMALSITEGLEPGYDQVAAIEAWLRKNIRYAPGSAQYPISAVEVNQQQYGVCKDMAHLGIALCRGISIPARMVVGYLWNLEPMDLHAWFEAYVGGRWYTFDAVPAEVKPGYVAMGYGRDASDVAVFNQFGPMVIPTYQHVQVDRLEK